MTAIKNFRYVTKRDIDDFEQEVRKAGKQLEFTSIEKYRNIPPDQVLDAISRAKELDCFGEFVVCSVIKVKDPIVFGKVKDFKDIYFFIAQWGDDITLEEILGDVED